jgi:glycine betaine/proline transport system substrate-binding protein
MGNHSAVVSHCLHNRYRIRALKEPQGLLGGVNQAILIVGLDAESHIGTPTPGALENLHFGNNTVSALDDAL